MVALSAFPIKTVVILVEVNRCFDHMLGLMKSLNPEIHRVTGRESNHLGANGSNPVFFGYPDPSHSMGEIYQQVFGKPFDTSTANSSKAGMSATVMNGFQPEAVPVYKELVQEYVVFDMWLASTQPIKLFVLSATSGGLTSNDTDNLVAGVPQKMIFKSMEVGGHSFGIYFQYPSTTLFYRNLRRLKYIDNFHPLELTFKKNCEEGRLPIYVVVEQMYLEYKLLPKNDEHPSHDDVAQGQKLVKQVYERKDILVSITDNERGGFYDNVPTSAIISPPLFNFEFYRLGVQMPTIMVSPWIEPGTELGQFPTALTGDPKKDFFPRKLHGGAKYVKEENMNRLPHQKKMKIKIKLSMMICLIIIAVFALIGPVSSFPFKDDSNGWVTSNDKHNHFYHKWASTKLFNLDHTSGKITPQQPPNLYTPILKREIFGRCRDDSIPSQTKCNNDCLRHKYAFGMCMFAGKSYLECVCFT